MWKKNVGIIETIDRFVSNLVFGNVSSATDLRRIKTRLCFKFEYKNIKCVEINIRKIRREKIRRNRRKMIANK